MLAAEYPEQITILEHHTRGDPFNIPEVTARSEWYGLDDVPDVYMDGGDHLDGVSGACATFYSWYREMMLERWSETGGQSPVAISGWFAAGGDSVEVEATFELVDSVALGPVQASLFVAENGAVYYSNPYAHTTHAIDTTPVSALLHRGDICTISRTFPISILWNRDSLEVCACLQESGGSKYVVQAARIPRVADYTVDFLSTMTSIPLGNGTAFFNGTLRNLTGATLPLTLMTDPDGSWLVDFMVNGQWSSERTISLPPHAFMPVVFRVRTDGLVRLGTVRLLARAETSGRTETHSFRVFNGSPSILLVDDDQGRTDQTALQRALAGAGLLHEDWDIQLTYGGHWPPTAAIMGAYDVVIWQTGFAPEPDFDYWETFPIADYVEGGGRFYMSSPNLLDGHIYPWTFPRDILGVDSWVLDTQAQTACGTPGDPITDGMTLPLTFDRIDNLTPVVGAHVILRSETGNPAAVRWQPPEGGSVVFSTIPHNALSEIEPDPNNSSFLLQRIVNWLRNINPSSADSGPRASAGALSCSPNPLTRNAEIRLRLARPGRATVDVVDASGRLMRRLLDAGMATGDHRLSWNGRDAVGHRVPSGVYFLRAHGTGLDGAPGAREIKIIVCR